MLQAPCVDQGRERGKDVRACLVRGLVDSMVRRQRPCAGWEPPRLLGALIADRHSEVPGRRASNDPHCARVEGKRVTIVSRQRFHEREQRFVCPCDEGVSQGLTDRQCT